MTTDHTAVRITRKDHETLQQVALIRSLAEKRRISLTEALGIVIDAARPNLPELTTGRARSTTHRKGDAA